MAKQLLSPEIHDLNPKFGFRDCALNHLTIFLYILCYLVSCSHFKWTTFNIFRVSGKLCLLNIGMSAENYMLYA